MHKCQRLWLLVLLLLLGTAVLCMTAPNSNSPAGGYGRPTMHSEAGGSTEEEPAAAIDRIIHVYTAPTQLVIVTSKEGPVDALQISITVTDIEEGRTFPSFFAGGLWLMVNRGRYTVPFLRPGRWYGVRFTAERPAAGFGQPPNRREEHRLVHTPLRPVDVPMGTMGGLPGSPLWPPPVAATAGSTATAGGSDGEDPLFDVYVHRGGENAAGIFVSACWIARPQQRLNGSELLIHVRVECAHSTAEEDVLLPATQDGVTVEIAMEHSTSFEPMDNSTGELHAFLTPLQCHHICWKPSLRIATLVATFVRPFDETCHRVESTDATTHLRLFDSFEVQNSTLFVNTLYHDENNDDGFITIVAVPLGLQHNDSRLQYHTFSTPESKDGRFAVSLEENALYAVKYEYTKVRPVHYTLTKHFVAEMRSEEDGEDEEEYGEDEDASLILGGQEQEPNPPPGGQLSSDAAASGKDESAESSRENGAGGSYAFTSVEEHQHERQADDEQHHQKHVGGGVLAAAAMASSFAAVSAPASPSQAATNSSRARRKQHTAPSSVVDIVTHPYSLMQAGDAEEPKAMLVRKKEYEGIDVDVLLEPFCGSDEVKDLGTKDASDASDASNCILFLLTDASPRQELAALPLAESLCVQQPDFFFCANLTIPTVEPRLIKRSSDMPDDDHEFLAPMRDQSILHLINNRSVVDDSRCPPHLCYTASVLLDGESYPQRRRCVDIRRHFDMRNTRPPVPAAAVSTDSTTCHFSSSPVICAGITLIIAELIGYYRF